MPRTVWRYNTLRQSPPDAKYRLAVVQFKVPGAKNGGSDKGPDGNRIDSIPIANGVIAAGGACDLVLFDSTKNKTDVEEFFALTSHYDALIVRINPGQLSQGTPDGTQAKFDDLMNSYIAQGKLVWSSPKIQTQMGAKDALVKIGHLNCGLADTFAYYSEQELIDGFKATCAFQPRVIKQNRFLQSGARTGAGPSAPGVGRRLRRQGQEGKRARRAPRATSDVAAWSGSGRFRS